MSRAFDDRLLRSGITWLWRQMKDIFVNPLPEPVGEYALLFQMEPETNNLAGKALDDLTVVKGRLVDF